MRDPRAFQRPLQGPSSHDATSEIYKGSDLRPQVWSDVAAQIGPLFTADDVISRFKSLKDTFMKNYRKVNEAKKSGAGADDLYKPKWNMFTRLLFLKKVCSQSTSTSNVNLPANVSLEQESMTPLQYFDANLQELVDIPMDGIQIITQGPVSEEMVFSLPSPSPSTSRPSSAASCPPRKRTVSTDSDVQESMFTKRGNRKPSTESNTRLDDAVGALKAMATNKIEPPPPTDRAERFCSYLVDRLRKISDENLSDCEDDILATISKYKK